MADEIATSTPAVAASAPVPSAEAASAPNPAENTPPVPAASTEAAVSSPAAAPAAEPAKTETPAEPAKAETLLGNEKKQEEKPTESKEPPKAEEKPVETKEPEPAASPAYEPFKLPENVQFDAEKMGEFTKTLGEFETKTKASHDEVQALGQQLVDRHVAELNTAIERYTKSLTESWNKQANDWKEATIADPEIGGNRRETVLKNAGEAINAYGGTKEQVDAFYDLMETSKVGNHPAQIRMLNNLMNEISRLKSKYESEDGVKQLAAPQIAPKATQSKIQKMYGTKN